MCSFCKINKTVTNKINWIIVKEVRGPVRTRREAAIYRSHQKILAELGILAS